MAKIYCLQCNFGNDYTSSRPNFCGKCGKPFIDSTKASQPQQNQYQDLIKISQPAAPVSYQEPQKPRGRLNRIVEPDDVEYPEDATEVPQIDNIECELTVSNLRPNRESGKDVFNSGSASEAREIISSLSQKPAKGQKVGKAKLTQIKQGLKQDIAADFQRQLAKKSRGERESTEITG